MRRRKVPTGHHGSRVVKLAAVIGRGKERDQLSAGEELVPVLDYLVGPDDQVEIVLPQELLDHVLAERKRDAAILRNGVSRTEQTSRSTSIEDLTFSAHPLMSFSGSLQIKSQSIPVSGMSVGRTILAIWSTLVNSGFRGTSSKTGEGGSD